MTILINGEKFERIVVEWGGYPKDACLEMKALTDDIKKLHDSDFVIEVETNHFEKKLYSHLWRELGGEIGRAYDLREEYKTPEYGYNDRIK